MRRETGAVEYLDRPLPPADRDASLADIDRLNARFGGHALTLSALARLGRRAGARRLLVADVGGARGDFARRLADSARARGRSVRVVVVDRDPDLLAAAAVAAREDRRILLVRADAAALPFRPGAVDVVTMTLTLHHLPPDAAVRALAEMRAAARLGVIVNDLLRARLSLILVWLGTRLVARHRISWHDGPLSVRRAYSPVELQALAARAGIERVTITRRPWLGRLLAVIET